MAVHHNDTVQPRPFGIVSGGEDMLRRDLPNASGLDAVVAMGRLLMVGDVTREIGGPVNLLKPGPGLR